MNIQQFWESVLAQDEQKIRTYFHPKAYVNWHCITSEEKARKTGAGEVKWKVWNTST